MPPTYSRHEEELTASSGAVRMKTGVHHIPHIGPDTVERAIDGATGQQPGAPGPDVPAEVQQPAGAPGPAAQPPQQEYPPFSAVEETVSQEPPPPAQHYRPRVPIPVAYQQQRPLSYPEAQQRDQSPREQSAGLPTPTRTLHAASIPGNTGRSAQPAASVMAAPPEEQITDSRVELEAMLAPEARMYSLDVSKNSSVKLGDYGTLYTDRRKRDKKHSLSFRLHAPRFEQDRKTHDFSLSHRKPDKVFCLDHLPVIINIVKCGETKVNVTVSPREGSVKKYNPPKGIGFKKHVLELSAGVITLGYMVGVHTVPEVKQIIETSVMPQIYTTIVPLIALVGTISMYISSKISGHVPNKKEVKR
jgi:hypothetical protein